MTYSLTDPFPEILSGIGFSSNMTGGHMARSFMINELELLHRHMPIDAAIGDYKLAIEEDNLLGKPTESSRRKSYRHLVELYGLDQNLLIFRVMRQLANEVPEDLPLLAMLCTYCRDFQLRRSFELVEKCAIGDHLTRTMMESHIDHVFPAKFSPAMLKSLAQNVNTTWTGSGHLTGRSKKIKTSPRPRWASATYAMFLGYLLGSRGQILLGSVFGKLIASEPAQLVAHLQTASTRGWLRLCHGGGVTEIDFSELEHSQPDSL